MFLNEDGFSTPIGVIESTPEFITSPKINCKTLDYLHYLKSQL